VERENPREWEGPALEGREAGIGLSGSERANLAPDQPMPLDGLLDTNAEESSVADLAWQSAAATSGSRDQERADPAVVAKADQDRRVSFSADLLDTYFRQMGNGELLSREAEIALAKRIEAAQQSVLEGLCHVPLLMDRIAQWAGELRQGRLLLADLVDISKSGDEFLGAGVGQAMLSRDDAMDGESAADGDIGAPSAGGLDAAGPRPLRKARTRHGSAPWS
jgi:RNA polymerase primary sigma factor